MERDYDEYLDSIKISSFMRDMKYDFYTDNSIPEEWQKLEVPNGEFPTATLGNYHNKDVTTRLMQLVGGYDTLSPICVIPLDITLPPLTQMYDEPVYDEQNISFGNTRMKVFGWWEYSKIVHLHPILKRHPGANLIIDIEESDKTDSWKAVGLTYFESDTFKPQYDTILAIYRDACHQYFVELKKDFWKIEIRKSIYSKLTNTNISLPRYMFKNNKLLQDGVMFKIKNDEVMLWDEKGTIHIYNFESQNHWRFLIDELPDVINDKEIKKLLNFNMKDIEAEAQYAARPGRDRVEELLDTNYALSKGMIENDNKMQELIIMAVKLLAAYCTPTLKKGIKKISKKGSRGLNKRKRTKQPTKWVWGTNHITYIYPPEMKKKKGVSEYYCRPAMAKYYIVNLDKYNDRPIYEEANENPRYRHSVILSRAGSWKGGKEKLFIAGGEKRNYSDRAISWLKQVSKESGRKIQHAENGKEFRIELGHDKYYLADGYCSETNTVYEFNGDYWHGNPDVYNADDINKSTKTSFGELYKNTIRKENILTKMGFNIVSIWENDWVKTMD